MTEKIGIAFDVGGTLVEYLPARKEAFKIFYDEFAEIYRSQKNEDIPISFDKIWTQSNGDIGGQADIFESFQNHFSLMLDPESFAHLTYQKLRNDEVKNKKIDPNLYDTLSNLSDSTIITVASNTLRENIADQMEKMGIADLFPNERRFSVEDKSQMKPDPYVYQAAKDFLMSIDGMGEVIAADDKPVGIFAAKEAGIPIRVGVMSNPTVTRESLIEAGATHIVKNLIDIFRGDIFKKTCFIDLN